MIRFVVTACLLSATLLWNSTAQAQLEVGAAMQVITPDPLLPISGGVGIPKPATGKQGELTARAMVFRKVRDYCRCREPRFCSASPQCSQPVCINKFRGSRLRTS